jgi:hypothetical protein
MIRSLKMAAAVLGLITHVSTYKIMTPPELASLPAGLDAAGFGADDQIRPCRQRPAPFGDREFHQVAQAREWLRKYTEPAKTAHRDSYGLKHRVEGDVREYVANGSLIAAAILEGYRVERYSRINGFIYLKSRRRPAA